MRRRGPVALVVLGALAGWVGAACSSAAASPSVRWSPSAFPYEADVPAGFTVSLDTPERVDLSWAASGDLLRLELVSPGSPAPAHVFDTECGSHECTSALVVVQGDLRCTYMDRFSTDVFDEEPTEDELEARLGPIVSSLRRRP